MRPTKKTPVADGELLLTAITESPTNPRRRFDAAQLDELAASIREIGLVQPILVRPLGPETYELVCGARRLRAARQAGLQAVPAIVRTLTDLEAAHCQVVENSQRADVSPVEEARAFAALRELGEASDETAARIGRPGRYVRDRLNLLELPEPVVDLIDAGGIHLGAALQLCRLSPSQIDEVSKQLIEEADDDPWTLNDLRMLVRTWERRLSDAPWALDDATLAPEAAGPCSKCHFRTDLQVQLFDHAVETPRCTHAPCWTTRLAAHWERVVTAADARVMDKIPKAESTLNAYAKDGDAHIYADKLGQIAGAKPVLVPREYGDGYKEHYLRSEVLEGLRDNGREDLAEQLEAQAPGTTGDKELRAAQKALERQREAIIIHVADVAPMVSDSVLLPLLVRAYVMSSTRDKKALERRGAWTKDEDVKAALETWLETASADDCRAFLAECIVASIPTWYNGLDKGIWPELAALAEDHDPAGAKPTEDA